MTKNNTSVFSLLMFHETRATNTKKYFRVLICDIYTIIDNCFCIGYLACQSKQLSSIYVDYKYLEKYFNRILGIGIPDLLLKLLSCHGFSNNRKSIVVLNCPKRMLEYYFSKWFDILECNSNHLKKIPTLVKQRIHAEETHHSDYVMTFISTIPSI